MEGVGTKQTGKAKRKEKRLQSEPSSIEGGANGGPRGINVLDFAEARAMELSNMLKAIRSKSGSKRVFQLLPRHMRRRAMSHNVKRLPRRLRAVSRKETEGLAAATTKLPSRRQRRKQTNLRQEYLRRQRSHVWLETHIWHAKRMHMVNKWGYRLAHYLNEKGVRFTYRSLLYGCLLMDLSYYQCIQVSGPMKDILSALSPLFSTDTGLTIGARAFTTGQREGTAVMYHAGTYPSLPVGPVQFLWRAMPSMKVKEDEPTETGCLRLASKLWIFCHPSMFGEALREVQTAVSNYDMSRTNDWACGVGGASEVGVVMSISVQELKDELLRFRLLGPRSHAVLMAVLTPVLDFCGQCVTSSTSDDAVKDDTHPSPSLWGEAHHTLQQHARLLSSLYPSIKAAVSSSYFSRGTVVGMVVSDPRLCSPASRTDMVSSFFPKKLAGVKGSTHDGDEDGDSEDDTEQLSCTDETLTEASLDGKAPTVPFTTPTCHVPILPPEIAYSPLWDDGTRNLVSLSKVPDHILNEARSKQFPRRDDINIGVKGAQIPVLLIHQSLSNGCSPAAVENSTCITSCGWDLLLPKNWGMAFWVALIYHGGHACGLKELQRCMLECRTLMFPNDFPDTLAGKQENKAIQEDMERKYRLNPPEKRQNYGKFSIATPFHCSWETLFTECSEPAVKRPKNEPCNLPREVILEHCDSSFYVLRSRDILCKLSQFMEHMSLRGRHRKVGGVTCIHGTSLVVVKEMHPNALVAVSFEMFGRGKVGTTGTTLYVPTIADLRSLVNSKSFCGPIEPINPRGMTLVTKEFIQIGTSLLSKRQRREIKGLKCTGAQTGSTSTGAQAGSTSTDAQTGSTSTGAQAGSTSTGAQTGSTSTGAQAGSTSTGAQTGSTSTGAQAGSTSTGAQTGSTSTGAQAGSTSTGTQAGSTSSGAQAGSGGCINSLSSQDFMLQPVTPSRQVIGYATRTGYQLSTSKFGGLGFVSLSGILRIIELNCEAGVGNVIGLARSHGTQYRFVRLQLLI